MKTYSYGILPISHIDEVEEGIEKCHAQIHNAEIDEEVVGGILHPLVHCKKKQVKLCLQRPATT